MENTEETFPRRKCYGSKDWVCANCGSLLNEVDDTVCHSCNRKINWEKADNPE